jgi:hypothetical protein
MWLLIEYMEETTRNTNQYLVLRGKDVLVRISDCTKVKSTSNKE